MKIIDGSRLTIRREDGSREERGFILLEVMLSLVILIGGTLVIFQSYRSSLHAVRQTEEQYKASLLLEAHMEELEKTGRFDSSSVLDSLLGKITWQQDVREGDPPPWKEHQLTLAWGQGKHANSLTLATYRAD